MSVSPIRSALGATFTLPEPFFKIAKPGENASRSSKVTASVGYFFERLLITNTTPRDPKAPQGTPIDLTFTTGRQISHIYATRIGQEFQGKHTKLSSLVTAIAAIPLAILNIVLKVVRFVVHLFQTVYFGIRALCKTKGAKDKALFKLGQAISDLGSIPLEIARLIYVVFFKYGPGAINLSITNTNSTRSEYLTNILALNIYNGEDFTDAPLGEPLLKEAEIPA